MYGNLIYSDYTSEMEARRRPLVRQTVSTMLLLGDLAAISGGFILALLLSPIIKNTFFSSDIVMSITDYAKIQDIFFVWMCPFVVLLFFIKGHYTQRIPWWTQVLNVLVFSVFALLIDGFIRIAIHAEFSRILIFLSWFFSAFLILGTRQIVYKLAKDKGLWDIPTVVIGDVQTVVDTLYAFANDDFTGYRVHTVFLRDQDTTKFKPEELPGKYQNVRVIKNIMNYEQYMEKNMDHFYVIALETYRGEERDRLINTLKRLKSLYAIIPPISRMSLYEMEPRYFFGHDIMLLHAKQTIFSPLGSFLKRAMDIAVSATALLLLSPILIGTMIMLKLEGQGGSLFYGGYRIGRKGQRFACWKFRSMEPDSDHLLDELLEKDPEAREEWEKYRKLKKDPRVTTKTARIIRKTSIDELPQLWNVLVGDMSLVGPRPILDKEIGYFGDSLNEYLEVRPGITGLWQVSGRNETTFERRVYWDSWYVRNWSVWGDIVIMIKTLKVVACGHGAY